MNNHVFRPLLVVIGLVVIVLVIRPFYVPKDFGVHERGYMYGWEALGARRIPEPTTAGDFCRRFDPLSISILMDVFNKTRLKVWKQQPDAFFDEALIEADGTMVVTGGECKQGIDINYKGEWGYHPLVESLANTGEPLYLVNRIENRPSHEHAAEYFDRAIALCRRAGFRRITLRGDTDFSQTTELDRWTAANVRFVFGIDAMANLYTLAENQPKLVEVEIQQCVRAFPGARAFQDVLQA